MALCWLMWENALQRVHISELKSLSTTNKMNVQPISAPCTQTKESVHKIQSFFMMCQTVYEPQLLKTAQTGLLHVLLVPRMEPVVQKHCPYMWNLNDIPCSSCILSTYHRKSA